MEAKQNSYELKLDNKEYVKKIRKMKILKKLIHNKLPLTLLNMYMRHESIDTEDYVVSLTRGFPPDSEFLQKFRVRPNAALMKNLLYRL